MLGTPFPFGAAPFLFTDFDFGVLFTGSALLWRLDFRLIIFCFWR